MDTREFIETPDEELKCGICKEVLVEPRCCREGHFFCRKCIMAWLATKRTCPIGRQRLLSIQLARGRLAERMIEKLRVRCRNAAFDEDGETSSVAEGEAAGAAGSGANRRAEKKQKRCVWTGLVSHRSAHFRVCAFETVGCPHAGCKARMDRRHLESHRTTCPFREERCAKCRATFVFLDKTKHLDTCPKALTTCTQEGCGESFLREDAQKHAQECPMQQVTCFCGAKYLRRDEAAHERSAIGVHNRVLLRKLREQKIDFNLRLAAQAALFENKLRKEKAKLKKRISRLQERLNDLMTSSSDDSSSSSETSADSY